MKSLLMTTTALALLATPAFAGDGMGCNKNRNTPAEATTIKQSGSMVQTSAELAPVGNPEASKVISVVSSIPLAVDLAAYDLAEKAFADPVVIDYTSLWGGKPNTMKPSELMTAWRGIVPGFDATWHELSKVEAKIDGDKATATAFVDGRHWIGDKLWRPVGNYQWQLAKQNGQWKVTHMTFAMTEEIGDRAVANEAMERVKKMTQ